MSRSFDSQFAQFRCLGGQFRIILFRPNIAPGQGRPSPFGCVQFSATRPTHVKRTKAPSALSANGLLEDQLDRNCGASFTWLYCLTDPATRLGLLFCLVLPWWFFSV